MTQALFIVDNFVEINVLLRALFAAKFYAPDDGPELAGSPILADLCERAIKGWDDAPKPGRRLGETQKIQDTTIPDNRIVESVRRHIFTIANRRNGHWQSWSAEQRADYVKNVFRPYIAPEPIVEELATINPKEGITTTTNRDADDSR